MKIAIRKVKGFSLIEILVVIAIIAILVTLTLVALGYVERKRNDETAKVVVQSLSKALQEFEVDNGYYPLGKGDERSSNSVYVALYGDETNSGRPTENARTKVQNKVYYPQLDPALKSKDSRLAIKLGGEFVIVDPWGQPYRYRLGFRQKDDKGKEGPGINPDFDLWSVGADGKTTQSEKKTGIDSDNLTNW